MKFLVTGGSGFIGTAVVTELLSRGHEVINLDIDSPIKPEHNAYWVAGNIIDGPRCLEVFQQAQPDIVLHLAARADINSTSWNDFASIHLGTENIIKAVESVPSIQAFVNTSTQLTIGPQYEPRSLTDFRPYTIYGEAKAYAEGLLLRWQHDVNWVTIRPANIWGPYHPSFADAIWRYLRTGQYLHPSGAPVYRAYGYVDNTARQIIDLALADRAKVNRQIFYGADAVLDSAIWVDAFAKRLTNKPARRVPPSLLRVLGLGGDLVKRLGLPAPIDSGRAMRITESYKVPVQPTLDVVGAPKTTLDEGADMSVVWLLNKLGS